MRIILHIGTHKTGTTSIQKFCARNRERLRAGGLWYPDYDLIGAESHYAHHHLANAIAGLATSRGERAEAARFFAAIREQAGESETVLISAEAFWRHVTPPVALAENEREAAGAEASYWAGRRCFVDQVAEVAGTENIEVVAVLRRQDECAESMFKERVKGTSYAAPFEIYFDAFSHRFRYFDQLSVWADVFPKVEALVYDDLAAIGDLVRAFFDALHVPLEGGLESVDRLNVSMSNDLIAYKRALNGSGLSEDELYAVAEMMLADGFGDGLALDQGSTLWADSVHRQNYLAGFEEQNAKVVQRFSARQRDLLFPLRRQDTRRAYGGLEPATAQAIASRLDALRGDRREKGKSTPMQ